MKTRVTYYVVCIMGILVLVFPLILNTVPISQVIAAESTPSAGAKSKLQALQAEIASRAAKMKLEIGNKLQNKVYSGFIKSKSANSLTLATPTGSKIININEYTVYQAQNATAGKANKQNAKNIATDDYILALGDIDDTEVLTAKKIIKTASPSAQRQLFFGTVTNLDGRTVVIQTKQGQNISLLTEAGTEFKMGKVDSSLEDIKVNRPIIAVGVNSSAKTINARYIYILPYFTPLKTKVASPSATPHPSKSATSSGNKKL